MEVERSRRVRERFRKACVNGNIWVPPIKFHGSLLSENRPGGRQPVPNSSYVLPIVQPPVPLLREQHFRLRFH
jgi:hypothetical protein